MTACKRSFLCCFVGRRGREDGYVAGGECGFGRSGRGKEEGWPGRKGRRRRRMKEERGGGRGERGSEEVKEGKSFSRREVRREPRWTEG